VLMAGQPVEPSPGRLASRKGVDGDMSPKGRPDVASTPRNERIDPPGTAARDGQDPRTRASCRSYSVVADSGIARPPGPWKCRRASLRLLPRFLPAEWS